MTIKGRQKHYNVKFLKGYGFSIKVKDSKIVLKDCHEPFAEPTVEEWYVNNMPYEKIVMSGKGYISTEALSLLSQHNRSLVLVDTYGSVVTYLNPAWDSLTNTKYRMGQYTTFQDKVKCDYLSKQIVKAKLDSQIKFLKSTNSPEMNQGISKMMEIRNQIASSGSVASETKASRIYFKEFVKLIPARYEFVSRNQSFIEQTKHDATDIINTLLNYGYTVLSSEISKFINGMGLDVYYGYYHHVKAGSQSFVYDMMEPFRWLVDWSVWKMATDNKLSKREYGRTREGKIIMTYELIKRFLEKLERAFQTERRYQWNSGKKTHDGMRMCQEITIAKIAVQNMANFCISKSSEFVI